MKLIALLLIINSHSDVLFPDKIRALATGGAMGNSIFFAASGYLTKFKPGSGWKDILRRFIRLYVPVYLFCAFTGSYDLAMFQNPYRAFRMLVWLTPYWFVGAVFLSCLLLFLMNFLVLTQKKYFVHVSIVFLAVYFLSYIFGIENKDIWIVENGNISGTIIPFKCLYSFFIYYAGFMIRENDIHVSGKISAAVMFVSFVLTYLVKFLMHKNIIPMSWQVLNQFSVMFFALSCVCFAIEYEESFSKLPQRVLDFINSLSRISLESYIVQGSIISFIASRGIVFPLNILLALMLTIICAYIFCAVNTKIFSILFRKK